MGSEDYPQSLTLSQRFHFDAYGFVLLPDMLSADETQRMKAAVLRARDASDEERRANGVYWGRHGSGPHHFHCGNLLEFDPAILEYATHPRLIPLVEDIVGGEVRIEEVEAIVNSRDPDNPGEKYVGFHAGTRHGWGTYIEENRFHCIFVKTLTYLTDVGPLDGGTSVIPGSHRMQWPESEMRQAALEDPSLVHQVSAKAGTTLLFAESLIHSTTRIESDIERVILITGYTPTMMREWPGNEVNLEWAKTLPERERRLVTGEASWHWKRRY